VSESALVQSILLEFGSRSDMRIWRANVLVAQDRNGRVIRAGIKGQADISGVLRPSGRRIEIECKTKTGRQSKEQQAWQRMIEWAGGLYLIARSIEDVRLALGPPPSERASPSPGATKTTAPCSPRSTVTELGS